MKFNVTFYAGSNGYGKNLDTIIIADNTKEAIEQAMQEFANDMRIPKEEYTFRADLNMSSAGNRNYEENFEAVPALYRTQDREAGNMIEEFFTEDDARVAIVRYERDDKADNASDHGPTYTPDFYAVATLTDDGRWIQI